MILLFNEKTVVILSFFVVYLIHKTIKMRVFKLRTLLICTVLFNISCGKAQERHLMIKKETKQIEESIIIGKKIKVNSKILNQEKEIYLSLPHKYEEHIQCYPVVFVLEAEFLFEPTKAISSFLAARSKMPEAIIVGIPNDFHEQRHELGFKKWKGKPEEYLNFFRKELIPFIESNYRADSHRTIIAMSPTNGFLFEAFFNQPDVFNAYIALTMHWDWNPENNEVTMVDHIIKIISNHSYPKSSIYIGTADDDMVYSGEEYLTSRKKLDEFQKSKSQVKYKVELLENEEHYSMALVGLRNAFKFMYPNEEWKFQRLQKMKDPVKQIKDYYDSLSKKYGFDIYPLEDTHGKYGIVSQAENMIKWKMWDNEKIIAFIKLGLQYYPNSANLHMKLAKVYRKAGYKKESIETVERTIQLVSKYHPSKLKEYQNELSKLKE
ncbi:conserved protein of unknown function [Tenacibaculum sp. 190524A02b]